MKMEASKAEVSIPDLSPDLIALRRIRFFRYLTDADLSRLARIAQRRSYAADEVMVEKGSDRGGLFVVLSGAAEVEAGAAVHLLGPGDFFGEMALLEGSVRTATVRATQPVQAMVFETMDFRAFLIENPSVAVTLLEGIAERLHEAQDRLDADRAWW
jgi:CRP-like cAMP-binding protein